MEERQGRKLHGIWTSCSPERKVRWITISTAAAVILSIIAMMLVAGYGMKGLGDLLMGSSRSPAFWSAMDAGSSSFQYYVGDRTPENREKYEMSCAKARSVFKSLSFDYEEIGVDRYGVTWPILNMYENYTAARDAFLEMEEGVPDYLDRLCTIYWAQGYLATHAGRLEQMTVESGNGRYKMQWPLFIIVPAVSILWGATALLMIGQLNRLVQRNTVRPMVELAEDSRRIRENGFTDPDAHAEGGDEIASLARVSCTIKAGTRGYIETLTEKHKTEKQLDEVRFQMPENQINPHFLLDILSMIASMAQTEGVATTEETIHVLSRLSRYSLKPTDSVMPLKQELKMMQDYMYLQQMRFGQRARYDTDCNQDTLETLVPSFTLQFLVESVIIYDISPKGQGGRIHVRSWMEGRRIWISVADTGRGMARERLEEIRRVLARGEEKATGVGVGNTCRRVHGMYQDSEIFVYSSEGRGTAVQMAFTP